MGNVARMIAGLGAFGGGYANGRVIGEKLDEARRNAEVRDQIAKVDTNFAPSQTPVASGEEALGAGQQAYQTALNNATSKEEITQIQDNFKPTLDALDSRRQLPASVVNSMGTGASFQQQAAPFSVGEVQGAKTRERAAIYQRAGREDDAARVLLNGSRMRELEDQDKIRGAYVSTNSPGTGLSASMDASATSASQKLQPGAAKQPADFLPHYLETVAPRVQAEYLRQGKLAEAKSFQDLMDSQDGKLYAKTWAGAVNRIEMGDLDGAVPYLEKLYTAYPDGKRAEATKLDDGRYQIKMISEATGKVVNTIHLSAEELSKKGAMALRPEKLAEFMATQEGKRRSERAIVDRQIQLEQLRQSGQGVRDDRRDERLGQRLDAQSEALDKRLSAGGGLSVPQQRTNDSIEAARIKMKGMSQPDVVKKSQPGGREYDQEIARIYRLANTRKYGEDTSHDAFSSGTQQNNAATPIQKATAALAADPAMAGFKLGDQTMKGFKVYDSNGKHVGYFGKP